MNIRIIVPRRADGGHRDRLWDFCRTYWQREAPRMEIHTGDHDEGPFNRSAAINAGARGEWDVAVILDGDVILDVEQVEAGIERAVATGKLVLPFTSRVSVNENGTAAILDGYQGAWDRWVIKGETQTFNVSTCLVVTRALWDQVGGFDERFEGWGGEDDAFHAACKCFAGVDRLPGRAWHLWHPISQWRDWRSPLYTEAKALSDRYISYTGNRGSMRALLAEPRTPEQTVVVLLTNGKRLNEFQQTIESADANLRGPIGRKVIVADSCRPHQVAADGWDVVHVKGGTYWRAVSEAQKVAVGSGQPWVFWLEDDFLFNDPVDITAMQRIMHRSASGRGAPLAQVSLLRQPWYEHEREAGGVLSSLPHATFTEHGGLDRELRHVVHQAYWTMNPMLTTRRLLATVPWPRKANSERLFGQQVFELGLHSAVLGSLSDPPRVTHIGEKRAGTGY